MAEAEAGLELPIGLTEKKFMQQLARIEARSIRTANKAEQAFVKANSGVVRSASRTERSVSASLNGIGRSATLAAGKVLALAASLGKLTASSQSYKVIENRLRSIGEYSDEAAEKLAAAAIRSRAPLEDMATTVARIQKATGDGYDETIRRVETMNKLLAVGGATAAEVNSVVIQLSQALSSGVLQGDELRSLRESAPVEVLDAIAAAAGGTRGELKKMGEEGKLTTEVIVRALDSLATQADAKFGETTQTISQAFTNINTGLTLFAGRLDEGLGATSAFADALSNMGSWLANNADVAEELGISIKAALQTGSEVAGQIDAAMVGLAETIHSELVDGTVLDLGEAFSDTGLTVADVIDAIINAIADMNGVIEGAAAAVREAFLQIPDAISGAMQTAINAVIAGVEAMVNQVLAGVRTVAAAVDSLTAKIPGGAGTNLAAGIGNVSLGRVDGLATNLSGGSVGDAYRGGYERGRGAVMDAVESVTGFFEGIGETYQRNRAELAREAAENDVAPPGTTPPARTPGGSGAGAGSGGGSGSRGRGGRRGGGGRSGREDRPFFEDVERDLLNLQRQIELIGKSNQEVATARARWEMLDEAKKRGIPVNATLNAQINAQAEEVGRLTAELECAEISHEQFEEAIDGIAGAMSDALVQGESLREGLANVFKGIAADLLKSGIKEALMSVFGGGGGGGLWGAVLGAFGIGGVRGNDDLSQALRGAMSFDGGGFTGFGSRSGGIDGKGGFPAILHPNETVVDHTRGQRVGANVTYSPSLNIAGDASERTVALIEGALEREREAFFSRWTLAQREYSARIA